MSYPRSCSPMCRRWCRACAYPNLCRDIPARSACSWCLLLPARHQSWQWHRGTWASRVRWWPRYLRCCLSPHRWQAVLWQGCQRARWTVSTWSAGFGPNKRCIPCREWSLPSAPTIGQACALRAYSLRFQSRQGSGGAAEAHHCL